MATLRKIFFLILLLISTPTHAQTYSVERVIDGNTIVITTPEGKSERVRLIGIDTPESKPNDKAKRDSERTGQDFETINKIGQEATKFIRDKIKEGQDILLEFGVQKRDKYGRLLAYVYIEWETLYGKSPSESYLMDDIYELFVNATIIKSGYATPMTIPPNVKYADLFKELYEEAREQKRGLWRNIGENKQTLWKKFVEEGREKSFPPQIVVQYLKNDLDRDGNCDEVDILIFNKVFGECLDGGNYNTLADADHDRCITESDRQLLFPCNEDEGE